MTKKRPIRRYSVARRAALLAKYYVQKSLTIPAGLSFLVSILLCAVLCAFSLIGIFLGIWALITDGLAKAGFSLFVIAFSTACCALFGYSTTFMSRLLSRILHEPKGHILNPVRPDVDEVLPQREVLVRASMPNNAETLLRASVKSNEDTPKLLLRASSADTTE